MRKTALTLFSITSLLLLSALLTVPARAHAGFTPEPLAETFVLELSSIKNGESDVPRNPIFTLNFSKNIADISVMVSNSTSFHLVDETGSTIPIRVIFPDGEMQRAYRDQLFVEPKEHLNPNSSYSLVIDNTLQAKNGETIDDAYVFTFTTSDQINNPDESVLLKLGDEIMPFDVALDLSEASVPKKGPTNNLKPMEAPKTNHDYLALTLFLASIGVFILLIITKTFRSARRQTST